MLNVPQLDDLTYQEIFARARGRIATLTGEWTDVNYHDPGITVLSTFAWLTDTLNYYMNAAGEAHSLKYMKLLGLRPEAAAARCTLALDAHGAYTLPQGTRILAGEIPFEIVETAHGAPNRLCALVNEIDGKAWNVHAMAGVDGQFAPVFSANKQAQCCLYFGFAQTLSGDVALSIEAEQSPYRNAFAQDFALSQCTWEYFDGTVWQEISAVDDRTCGFLRTGMLYLKLDGETQPWRSDACKKAHYLRCTLCENDYDVPPKLGRITLNTARAVQANTLAKAVEMPFVPNANGNADTNANPILAVDWWVEETDTVTVWVADATGAYTLWCDGSDGDYNRCAVQRGAQPWQREIVFCAANGLPEEGTSVLVHIVKESAALAVRLGQTLGCAEERRALDVADVYQLSLGLIAHENGAEKLEIWRYTEDLLAESYDAMVFTIDEATQEIMFGDGIHGLQPPPQAQILAMTLSTSLFAGGNVRAHTVTALPRGIANLSAVYNLRAAEGGIYRRASEDLAPAIAEKIQKTTRAVTAEDYQNLVKATPGLMIDCVNVISMKDYARCYGQAQNLPHNTVVVAVKPHSNAPTPKLSENYARIIRTHLEQYRLLTTDIRVVPAQYVHISVGGRIHVRGEVAMQEAQVTAQIREVLDGAKRGAFGEAVQLNKLFSRIELLEGVVKVEQLSLEYVGEGGRKNSHGDILLYPDALACLGNMQIEFVTQ